MASQDGWMSAAGADGRHRWLRERLQTAAVTLG